MFEGATLEKAIEFTRISVALTFYWPDSPTPTESQLLRLKIVRTVLTLNGFILLLPLIYATYVHRDDPIEMSKAFCLTFAVLQGFSQSIYCSTQYNRFQRLIEEMKFCCKTAKSHERKVYQQYVNKYSTFYGVSSIWVYVTVSVIVMGGVVLSQQFPTNAEYPFSVDNKLLWAIIFLHQAVAGLHCAAHVCFNTFSALVLFFSAARFQVLKMELCNVTVANDLIKCLKKYYRVKRYAQEAANAVRYIAMITVLIAGSEVVFCGLNCIGTQPFAVKVQFIFIGATALFEVFMCAWPSDHLMETSENTSKGIYESKWYERTVGMQKDILCMLIPQNPVVIKITCLIPTLCLNYYCSFISNVFSFFTALRVTMNEDD